MNEYFSQYLSDPHWLIFERGWNPEQQLVNEARFALGNGYIGSRAILEEIPPQCEPGTFFAGVYDKTAAHVTELINAPNPIDCRITAQGEKLDVTAMEVLSHQRMLDIHQGLLVRRTIYANARKKRFDYQSIRFFSMHAKHTAVMQIYLTPLDQATHFTIETLVDTSITNKGLVTEGEKKHTHVTEILKSGNINYVCVKTLEKEILIAYASQVKVQRKNKTYSVPYRTFYLNVKKGETVCITKFFSFYTTREIQSKRLKTKTIDTVRQIAKKGFVQLINKHCQAWAEKWKPANIEIEGDPDVERVIRFNIYHLLSVANEKADDISIGAKCLTGQGYRGHIFWDTEIFLLPFYIYTHPQVARNILLYRYHRLDTARQIASDKGYRGALFPWESADSGEETTPDWYKDDDGKVRKIYTNQQEQHITADIAYGVFHYYNATNDIDFMLKYGLEIIWETARFWASRVEYCQPKKRYEIKHVMGPDEFHEDVNNNAYTNALAQWNLEIACKIYRVLQGKYATRLRKLMVKINLRRSDLENWRDIARKIFVPISEKTNLIESFAGYFKRKKWPTPELDNNSLPLFPSNLAIDDIGRTQFIKQADAVMLLYLLTDDFTLEQKKKNYLCYEPRTLHKSSLSPSVHAIMGAEVSEMNKAYRYFLISAYTDLKDVYGNTSGGIHAATLGGTWQAVINGFAGMRIKKGILSFDPRLPARWKKIKFSVKWKGFDLAVSLNHEKIRFRFDAKRKSLWMPLRVYGLGQRLPANRTITYYRKVRRKAYNRTDMKGVY